MEHWPEVKYKAANGSSFKKNNKKIKKKGKG